MAFQSSVWPSVVGFIFLMISASAVGKSAYTASLSTLLSTLAITAGVSQGNASDLSPPAQAREKSSRGRIFVGSRRESARCARTAPGESLLSATPRGEASGRFRTPGFAKCGLVVCTAREVEPRAQMLQLLSFRCAGLSLRASGLI